VSGVELFFNCNGVLPGGFFLPWLFLRTSNGTIGLGGGRSVGTFFRRFFFKVRPVVSRARGILVAMTCAVFADPRGGAQFPGTEVRFCHCRCRATGGRFTFSQIFPIKIKT